MDRWAIAWLMTGLFLLAGCGDERLVIPADSPDAANFQAMRDAAVEVLRGYDFEIDKQIYRLDSGRREGTITTFPLTGKSWFEFWRKDGATCYDTLESTLQTIYRTAEVRILPAEGSEQYRVEVAVTASRSDQPPIQVTSTPETIHMYQLEEDGRDGQTVNYGRGVDDEPVTLGPDAKLAGMIQSEIQAKASELRPMIPVAE